MSARPIQSSRSVTVPHPIRVVHDYIADFSHAPRWDPATLHSAPTDDGPPGLTRTLEFTLVDLGGHTDVHLTIRYELCGLTAPARRWRQHHGLAELTEPAATALPAALGLELGERVPGPRTEHVAPHLSGGLDIDP